MVLSPKRSRLNSSGAVPDSANRKFGQPCTTKALVPLNLQNDSVARVKMISESWSLTLSFSVGLKQTPHRYTTVKMTSPKISKERWQMVLSISRVACVGLELNASFQSMDWYPKISQMLKPSCSTKQWHYRPTHPLLFHSCDRFPANENVACSI